MCSVQQQYFYRAVYFGRRPSVKDFSAFSPYFDTERHTFPEMSEKVETSSDPRPEPTTENGGENAEKQEELACYTCGATDHLAGTLICACSDSF